MAIAKKMKEFGERSSWIRKMFEQGAILKSQFGADNVFDFSLGNPDLPPPSKFEETLKKLAGQETPGIHGYMPNGGYPAVRAAVAKQIGSEQGVTLSGDDLLMTCGAAGAINVVLKAILDPGDEVIILAPYFVEYNFYIDNHGGASKIVSTASDFSLDLDAIAAAISGRTKAIIINSPNNPTGQIYSADELKKLSDILDKAGKKYGTAIYLIADEPYRKIIYDNYTVPGILPLYKNSLVVSSYSKDLSLPGERIGFIAISPQLEAKGELLGALTLANRILGFVNAPALMQRVIAELQGVTVDTSIYTKRRDLFCKILNDAGYEFIPPKGAFYLFPKSPIEDDARFVGILQEQKILAVPGRGFGMPGYFRLAFCINEKVIERSSAGFKKAIEAVRS